MRKIIISSAAALAAAAAAIVPMATAASASTTTTYKAVTVSPLHTDTTGTSGSATQADPQRGPVWASDHLKETVTATQVLNQPGHWNVTIKLGGSTFAGFADPRSAADGSSDPGGPLLSQGGITGSIQYHNVASATPPDPGSVPATQAPDTSLGAVLSELFDGQSVSAASTHYDIDYTPSMASVNVTGSGNTWKAGDTYTQVG
ncbi:MAG TPA: hypothetical protein VGI37_06830 [Streptosporangiaceae bacterium]|jgi:hypothetical protein